MSVKEEERPYSTNPGYEEPIYCRPPVPQRCGSLDRNIVDQIINPNWNTPPTHLLYPRIYPLRRTDHYNCFLNPKRKRSLAFNYINNPYFFATLWCKPMIYLIYLAELKDWSIKGSWNKVAKILRKLEFGENIQLCHHKN